MPTSKDHDGDDGDDNDDVIISIIIIRIIIIIITIIIIMCVMLLRCRLFLSLRRRSPKVSECSPANRERELGSETRYLYPADAVDIATVIETSTRGTHRSDSWYMELVERLTLRSEHMLAYVERL